MYAALTIALFALVISVLALAGSLRSIVVIRAQLDQMTPRREPAVQVPAETPSADHQQYCVGDEVTLLRDSPFLRGYMGATTGCIGKVVSVEPGSGPDDSGLMIDWQQNDEGPVRCTRDEIAPMGDSTLQREP